MKKKVGVMLTAGAVACTLLASVGLAGCGGASISEFVMPENGYDGSKVTITFATKNGQSLANVVEKAIPRFNKLYPNITVEIDNNIKDWDELADNIGTKITSGKQPNIAYCYSDHVASYNQAGACVALDEFFLPGKGYDHIMVTDATGHTEPLVLTQAQVDDYIDAFWEDGWVYKDEHMYTLPLAKSTEVLFYNVDAFKEFGIVDEEGNAKVPTTWAEMEEVCKTIKEKDTSDQCIALGYDSSANLFITRCQQKGLPYTSTDYTNHYQFNTQEHKDIVKTLKEWNDKGYLTTQGVIGEYSSNFFTVTDRTKRHCYMSIGSTGGAAYQLAEKVDGKSAFEVGVAPIPQEDPSNPKTILQGPNVCIFKKQNPQEVIASWLLVKFLTTEEEFQGNYSQVSGYSPVTESVFNGKVYKAFREKGTVMAQVAEVCYSYAKNNAFFTSPAFIGSSVAREQVENIVNSVLKAGKNIDTMFNQAIQECSRYKDI